MTMLVVTHEMGFALEVGDTLVFMAEATRILEPPPARVSVRTSAGQRVA